MRTPETAGRRPHLTAGQRAELLDLIGGQPMATCRMIARIFEERTGRTIGVETVRHAWVVGERYAGDRWNRPLTEAQRATLTRICGEEAPTYNRRAIVRRFEAETGRRICRTTVRYFLRRHLDVTAPAPNGRPRKAVTS